MKKIGYDKFILPKDLESAMPSYYFYYDGKEKPDSEILKAKMTEILEKRGQKRFSRILEMGVGTGRLTKNILEYTEYFEGIDHSESMVCFVKEKLSIDKMYVIGIKDYINNKVSFDQFDLICCFWAINHTILANYEEYDAANRQIISTNDLVNADQNTKELIRSLFLKAKLGTDFLFFYFDPISKEQKIVTEFWSRVCPFPYGKREYTLEIFIETLEELKKEGILDFSVDRVGGYVHYPNIEKMHEGFVNLHFKGFFNEEWDYADLINELDEKTSQYQETDGTYKIPAGFNIISCERINNV